MPAALTRNYVHSNNQCFVRRINVCNTIFRMIFISVLFKQPLTFLQEQCLANYVHPPMIRVFSSDYIYAIIISKGFLVVGTG